MGRKWWKKQRRKRQQQKKGNTVVSAASNSPYTHTAHVAKPCHEGVVGVFQKGHVAFWAGKARDVQQYNDWDLMICFSDRESSWENNDPQPYLTFNDAARKLVSPEILMAATRCPYIGINWPDFGEPDLGIAWWETLVKDIFAMDQEQVNVAVCCTGGHGRTGSALAILHHLCWPDAADDPVTMLRRIYCNNIVESQAQIRYIQEITGRNIKAGPAWVGARGGSSYWSQYEIGEKQTEDSKAQGSAAATKLAEIQTASELDTMRGSDIAAAALKTAKMDEEDGLDDEFIPVGSNKLKPGFIYRPIRNAAGDIIGWTERKDVAI